ncbi:MAG: hypothetical protein LBL43_07565 [Treponema sp.]|jgi:hypothetical protein|nr:hypothetical protein [Treponema sp.]
MEQIESRAEKLLDDWFKDFDIADTSWQIDLGKMEFKEAENRYVVNFFYTDEGKLKARLAHIDPRIIDTCKMAAINSDTFIDDVLRVATFLFSRELRKNRAAETASSWSA